MFESVLLGHQGDHQIRVEVIPVCTPTGHVVEVVPFSPGEGTRPVLCPHHAARPDSYTKTSWSVARRFSKMASTASGSARNLNPAMSRHVRIRRWKLAPVIRPVSSCWT